MQFLPLGNLTLLSLDSSYKVPIIVSIVLLAIMSIVGMVLLSRKIKTKKALPKDKSEYASPTLNQPIYDTKDKIITKKLNKKALTALIVLSAVTIIAILLLIYIINVLSAKSSLDSTTEFVTIPLIELVFGLVFTSFVYLFVPLIIITRGNKRTKKSIRKIAIFNALGCSAMFFLWNLCLGELEPPHLSATFLWGSIGYALLKRNLCFENDDDDDDPNRLVECVNCGYRSNKIFSACPKCGNHKKQYAYLNTESIEKDEPPQDNTSTESVESVVTEYENNNESASAIITPTPTPSTQNTFGQVIKCRKCGYESKTLFNSCPECGSYAKDYVQSQDEPADSQSRICRKCGEELLPDSIFCRKCGTKFSAKNQCRKCGGEIPTDSIYCHKCGAKNSSKSDFIKNLKNKFDKRTFIIASVTCISILAVTGIGTYIYIDNTTCRVYNCSNTCSGNYCYLHKCAVSDCDRIRETSGRYCYSHSCGKYGCYNRRIIHSDYCVFHTDSDVTSATCLSDGCTNIPDEFEDYCSKHKCNDSDCNLERNINQYYCDFHNCSVFTCKRGRLGSGKYCYVHTCVESGCYNRTVGNSSYCYMHGE